MQIYDDFEAGVDPRWRQAKTGDADVTRRQGALWLSVPPNDGKRYHNAQITEYDTKKPDFQFRPPLRMEVIAYSSLHPRDMRGTAGFGFWNHPFEPGSRRLKRPQALWFFFGAPPNDMQLAQGVPGHGWKAATIDARRRGFVALLPAAPLALLLMRIPALYRRLWPIGQKAMGVHEALLPQELLTRDHTYRLEWTEQELRWQVDDDEVLRSPNPPRGPLGFIAWMDNQYAVVTPQGRLRFGLSEVTRPQSLVLRSVRIEPL